MKFHVRNLTNLKVIWLHSLKRSHPKWILTASTMGHLFNHLFTTDPSIPSNNRPLCSNQILLAMINSKNLSSLLFSGRILIPIYLRKRDPNTSHNTLVDTTTLNQELSHSGLKSPISWQSIGNLSTNIESPELLLERMAANLNSFWNLSTTLTVCKTVQRNLLSDLELWAKVPGGKKQVLNLRSRWLLLSTVRMTSQGMWMHARSLRPRTCATSLASTAGLKLRVLKGTTWMPWTLREFMSYTVMKQDLTKSTENMKISSLSVKKNLGPTRSSDCFE